MGYLTIDHRAAGGKLAEFDTVNCKHCQAIIRVRTGQQRGAWCRSCQGPVCPTQACASACTPFLRKVEEAQARQRLWDSIE